MKEGPEPLSACAPFSPEPCVCKGRAILSIKAPEEQPLEIGDIVRGLFPDGSVIQSPVVSKIYKISNGLLHTECKVKGEE